MIIGILGYKRHGKDTIADYLVNNHNFTKYSLATPLKEALQVLFNFTDNQLNGDEKEMIDPMWGVSPRQTMQYVGTELFRNNISNLLPNVGLDFWLKCLENKIKKSGNQKIVIADIRFENEATFIKKMGGVIWKVQRNIINNDTHESESNIDHISYDYLIENKSSIENLYNNIELAINSTQKI